MFTSFNVQKHIIFLIDWLVMNMKHVLLSGKCQSAVDHAFFFFFPALKHRSRKVPAANLQLQTNRDKFSLTTDGRAVRGDPGISSHTWWHSPPPSSALFFFFYKQGNLRQTVQHPSACVVCVVILAPWTLPPLASKNKFCPRAIIRAALW